MRAWTVDCGLGDSRRPVTAVLAIHRYTDTRIQTQALGATLLSMDAFITIDSLIEYFAEK